MKTIPARIMAALALTSVALTIGAWAAFQTQARSQEKISKEGGNETEVWTTEFFEDKKDFSHTGRNTFFILEPGYYLVLVHGEERLTITVLDETKMVDGVETRVVEEKETKGGKPTETSRNYYAISKKTSSVYYFGEDVDIFKDGKVVDHSGAWLSGVKGGKYGLMMAGTPLLKGKYYHEIAPGAALDRAEIVSLNETVKTTAGTFKNCLKTEETTPLEPGTKDYKLYAPGVGFVGDGDLRLVEYGFLKKPKK